MSIKELFIFIIFCSSVFFAKAQDPNLALQYFTDGEYAKAAGIDALYTFGELSVEMTNAFGLGAKHYAELAALIVDVQQAMQNTSTVLVKGSRFMAMERVVDGLVNTSQQMIKTHNQCQESIGEAQ